MSEEQSSNQSTTEEAKTVVPKSAAKPPFDWLKHLTNVTVMVIVSMLVLLGYNLTLGKSNVNRIATIDLAEILAIKELQVTLYALAPNAGDEAKGKAFDEVARFGKDVEDAIDKLQKDCNCAIFVKAALVKAGQSDDLTPALKHLLGLDGLNQADLIKQLSAMGGNPAKLQKPEDK